MFLGVVPDKCISQIIRSIDFSQWPEIYTCCSGTFRFDRAIVGEVPGAKVYANDVSVFSVPLGRYALGEETPFEFVGALAPVEEMLDGRPYIERLAAILVASDYAKYKAGKPNRYKLSHAYAYEQNFPDLIKATAVKLDGVLRKIELAGFFAGDWVQHMRNGIARGAGIVAFPPFWKCLAPDHRLLTADMRWVPCGDLKVGDQLLAFDEYPVDGNRLRRWRFATVTHSAPAIKECVRVLLDNGDEVVCTADHPWLATAEGPRPIGDRGWVEAQSLVRQSEKHKHSEYLVRATVLKALQPWSAASSFEGGWMSGILDGEGTISTPHENAEGHSSTRVAIAQAVGPVADRIRWNLERHGFAFSVSEREPDGLRQKTLQQIHVSGGFQAMLRVLGVFQPQRLINRLRNDLDIGTQSVRVNDGEGASKVKVIAVERLGLREIQSISTSTGTYVGEGYLMHNSGYEKMFEFLSSNIKWDPPKYDIYDPKDLKGLVDELAGSGVPYCVLSDQKLDGHEIIVEYLAQARMPHYCYASTGHPSYRLVTKSGTPFKYRPIDVSKLTENSKVTIVETTGDRMNFLKDVYLKKTIQHVSGLANFLVYVDGMLAGGMIYALSKYNDHDCIYVLSDFSLSGKGRLAKLIARMTLSHTIIGRLENRYLWRFRRVATTAFTHHAVSMKYRGVMELKSRRPADDPALGNIVNYEGEVIRDTPDEIYRWWWDRHGRRSLGRELGAAAD